MRYVMLDDSSGLTQFGGGVFSRRNGSAVALHRSHPANGPSGSYGIATRFAFHRKASKEKLAPGA
jgi:hypothetical protein